MTDHVKDQLCARIEELEKEKLELNEQLDIVQQERDELSEQLKTSRRDYEVMNKFREVAEAERDALAAPVVQGEPVAWQFFQDGKWHMGGYTKNHRENTVAAGFPVRDLYTVHQPAEQNPECGCCGQTDRCDDDCDAVVIGGRRAAEQNPAPDVAGLVAVLEDIERLYRRADPILADRAATALAAYRNCVAKPKEVSHENHNS